MASGAPSPAESLETPRISLARTGHGARASWTAEVVGLPGCTATGATPEEAVRRAWAAAQGSRARVLEGEGEEEAGGAAAAAKHSGRLLVRMPATLHDELAHAAKGEGVSLNQFITGVLAGAVEWRRTRSAAAAADSADRPSARSLRVALAVNLAAVILAALVAITLLVAWRAGW